MLSLIEFFLDLIGFCKAPKNFRDAWNGEENKEGFGVIDPPVSADTTPGRKGDAAKSTSPSSEIPQ